LAQSEQPAEELADEDNARTLVPVKALTDADWDDEEGDEVLEDEELIESPEDQGGHAESLSEELGDEDQPDDDDDDDDDDDESVPDDAEPDDVDADDEHEGDDQDDDEDENDEAEVAGEADEHAQRKRTAEE
jgi:hypothetical protein